MTDDEPGHKPISVRGVKSEGMSPAFLIGMLGIGLLALSSIAGLFFAFTHFGTTTDQPLSSTLEPYQGGGPLSNSREPDNKKSVDPIDPDPAPLIGKKEPMSPTPAVGSEDTFDVLRLVSLEYWLDGQKYPRDHSLPPYIPLLASRNKGAREVAALSAVWEIYVWEYPRAFDRSVASAKRVIAMTLPFANVPPLPTSPTPPKVPTNLKIALAQAMRDGTLSAYQNANFPQLVFKEKDPDHIDDLFQSSADVSQVKLNINKMQAVLWNRAEALAKTNTRTDNSREDDIEVRAVFGSENNWGTMTVRNKSTTALQHFTLAVTAPTKKLPPGNPGLDLVLGMGVTTAARGSDSERNFTAGANLAGSVVNERAIWAMPVRRFIHVPKLAPGVTLKVQVFSSEADFVKTESAAYSIWANGIAIENRGLPEYDEAKKRYAAKQPPAGWRACKLSTINCGVWLPNSANRPEVSTFDIPQQKIQNLKFRACQVRVRSNGGSIYHAVFVTADPFTAIGDNDRVRIDWLRDLLVKIDRGKISGEKILELGRLEGREFVIESTMTVKRYRVYIVQNQFFCVFIEGTKEHVQSKDANIFFDSLTLPENLTGPIKEKDPPKAK
jgi:hypothetical protein